MRDEEKVLTILDDERPSGNGKKFGGKIPLTTFLLQVIISALIAIGVVMLMAPSKGSFNELTTKVGTDLAAAISSIDSRFVTQSSNLDTKFSGLQSTVDSKIAGIDSKVTAFDTRITNLSGLETIINNAISGIDGKVNTVVSGKLSVVTDNISSHEKLLGILENDVFDIEDRLAALENPASDGTVSGNLTFDERYWDIEIPSHATSLHAQDFMKIRLTNIGNTNLEDAVLIVTLESDRPITTSNVSDIVITDSMGVDWLVHYGSRVIEFESKRYLDVDANSSETLWITIDIHGKDLGGGLIGEINDGDVLIRFDEYDIELN